DLRVAETTRLAERVPRGADGRDRQSRRRRLLARRQPTHLRVTVPRAPPVLADPSTNTTAAQLQGRAGVSATPRVPAPSATPSGSARPAPPSPCRTNTDAQRIIVSIRQQPAWMCAGARQVTDSAVTTGAAAAGNGTPTGTWHIEARQQNTT